MDIEKLKKNKLLMALAIILLILAGAGYYYYESNKPSYGTWRYGVCRAFVELQLRFPKTMWVTQVVEDSHYAEIYVSYLNAHGMRPTRVYKCNYKQSGNSIKIDYITIDNEKIDDKIVNKFNQVVPFLINDPDLDTLLPDWHGLDLQHLRPEYRDRR